MKSPYHVSKHERHCLIAEINAFMAEVSHCYELLPGPAQASSIKLAHTLSQIQKRMQKRSS